MSRTNRLRVSHQPDLINSFRTSVVRITGAAVNEALAAQTWHPNKLPDATPHTRRVYIAFTRAARTNDTDWDLRLLLWASRHDQPWWGRLHPDFWQFITPGSHQSLDGSLFAGIDNALLKSIRLPGPGVTRYRSFTSGEAVTAIQELERLLTAPGRGAALGGDTELLTPSVHISKVLGLAK
jgi:hypothetical protein